MRPTAVLNQTLNKVQRDRPQVNDRNLRYTGAIEPIMQAIFWLALLCKTYLNLAKVIFSHNSEFTSYAVGVDG